MVLDVIEFVLFVELGVTLRTPALRVVSLVIRLQFRLFNDPGRKCTCYAETWLCFGILAQSMHALNTS
jgi:hypothetical protein